MITMEQFEILRQPEVRAEIDRSIEADPLEIALDKKLPHAALIASQVKYLRRARKKIPAYYDARCIIPSLAFEQATSQAVAMERPWSGDTAVDLTCGLGIDSFALSKKFRRVVALERDPVLAAVAHYNFALLGAGNIEVRNIPAEKFVGDYDGEPLDLIFADPDRRNDQGRKLVLLEDCSPDILSMLDRLRELSGRVAVKLSPLFDVTEAFRIFGPQAAVSVISAGGECKEILAETSHKVTKPVVRAVITGRCAIERAFCPKNFMPAVDINPADYKYLIVPDVSLVKAGIAAEVMREEGAVIHTDNSFAFSAAVPARKCGMVFEIETAMPYSAAGMKKLLREKEIRRINILKKEFPEDTARIAKALGVKEGGSQRMAVTMADGKAWAIILGRVR